MNFTRQEPTENFPLLRMVSDNNIWELGLVPVMFGVRVRVGKVGSGGVECDYCGGDDKGFILNLLAAVLIIMESLPESASYRDVEKIMPKWTRRPINTDPTCWTELCKLRDEIIERKEHNEKSKTDSDAIHSAIPA